MYAFSCLCAVIIPAGIKQYAANNKHINSFNME